jgi:hypothetical protein
MSERLLDSLLALTAVASIYAVVVIAVLRAREEDRG